MANTLVKIVPDFSTTLASKVSIGDTTAILTSIKDLAGNNLVDGKYGFTIDRNNTSKEYFTATLTGVNLTNIERLDVATGFGTAGFGKEHRKTSEVIISDYVAIKRIQDVLEIGYQDNYIPTTAKQVATKEYADGLTVAGSPNADTVTKGVGEIATSSEIDTDAVVGSTGADLLITPSKLALSKYGTGLLSTTEKASVVSMLNTAPIIKTYTWEDAPILANNTQFTITKPIGTTMRYTWTGSGTNPNINATTFPVGATVAIVNPNFNAANNGTFTITGSGLNYFEITNASGVVQSNISFIHGFTISVLKNNIWTKPANLKYIEVEVQAGGGGGGGRYNSGGYWGSGGGSGGYAKKVISASLLGATETLTVGLKGISAAGTGTTTNGVVGTNGGLSSFGTFISCTGGILGASNQSAYNVRGGLGGVATGGDINIPGRFGYSGSSYNSYYAIASGGKGGDSIFGRAFDSRIAYSPTFNQADAEDITWGVGGYGCVPSSNTYVAVGSNGGHGIIIIKEYY